MNTIEINTLRKITALCEQKEKLQKDLIKTRSKVYKKTTEGVEHNDRYGQDKFSSFYEINKRKQSNKIKTLQTAIDEIEAEIKTLSEPVKKYNEDELKPDHESNQDLLKFLLG
jgi:hypothetical protein